MIDIQHIASGSSGNSIVISDGTSKIMLDCGLPYSKLSRHVKCSELAGCLITHSHLDHAKAGAELMRGGVTVGMSKGTNDAHKNDWPFAWTILEHLQQIDMGSWIILPFDVVHDVDEPLGFLLQSRETDEKLVYIVDSGFVQYDFNGVTHWLLEANYSEGLLEAGPYDDYLKDRVRRNHFSLEDLKIFLKTSDLSQTQEIHLLHLSESNSNEQQFKDEIQALTGVPTYSISDSKQLA